MFLGGFVVCFWMFLGGFMSMEAIFECQKNSENVCFGRHKGFFVLFLVCF